MGKNFTLYEIDHSIEELIDGETGEIVDIERFEELQMAREDKVKQIALAYKNLGAEVAALKKEEEAFAERRKATQKRMESCKSYLDYALHGESYKSTEVCCTYRKSDAVIVDDMAAIPESYLRYAAPEPCKDDIKKALKAGEQIPGCRLETRLSLTVK